MQEETKEEYLARHRRKLGKEATEETLTETEHEPKTLKGRLKSWLLLFLFAVFILAIYQIFGMLKSN